MLCDTTDHVAIETAIARGCQLLYLESPTNPTLKVVDIARLTKAARAQGAVVVDWCAIRSASKMSMI